MLSLQLHTRSCSTVFLGVSLCQACHTPKKDSNWIAISLVLHNQRTSTIFMIGQRKLHIYSPQSRSKSACDWCVKKEKSSKCTNSGFSRYLQIFLDNLQHVTCFRENTRSITIASDLFSFKKLLVYQKNYINGLQASNYPT